MTDRSRRQCRDRWNALITQEAKKLHWTQEEDQGHNTGHERSHGTSHHTSVLHCTHTLPLLSLFIVSVWPQSS